MTCYPCYRNILHAMGVHTASLPLNHEYKVSRDKFKFDLALSILLFDIRSVKRR